MLLKQTVLIVASYIICGVLFYLRRVALFATCCFVCGVLLCLRRVALFAACCFVCGVLLYLRRVALFLRRVALQISSIYQAQSLRKYKYKVLCTFQRDLKV